MATKPRTPSVATAPKHVSLKPSLPAGKATSAVKITTAGKSTRIDVDSPPKRMDTALLDERRKLMADLIMQGVPKSQAYKAAGYDPATAKAVMRSEDVVRYIQDARAQLVDISTIKRADVLNIYLEAVDMARMLSDPAQMINGADKISKLMGYYEPEVIKVEVQGQNNLAKRITTMTDEELYALAASKARLVDGEVVEMGASPEVIRADAARKAIEAAEDDEGVFDDGDLE